MKIDSNLNPIQPNSVNSQEHSAEAKERSDKVGSAVKRVENNRETKKDHYIEEREQDFFDLDLEVSRDTQLLLNDNDGSKYCGSKKDDDCTGCGCHTWCSSC